MLLIFVCDLAMMAAHGILEIGFLDEPAHVATAGIVLLAVSGWSRLAPCRREIVVVLASSVLFDLDHVPLYLGLDQIAPGGRPVTHSLATVALLLAIALLFSSRRRRWPVATACGLCLHFVRDIATGPGISIFWPATDSAVLVSYWLYAAILVGLSAVATVRLSAVAKPAY